MFKYTLYYETDQCLTCKRFHDLRSCILWILLEFSEEEDKLQKIKILVSED
jgi:hypothetical protein